MANFENTVHITGPLSPIDDRDTYPTHIARFGKGGFYRVATLSDRNLIPDDRREQGLTVLVTDDINPSFNRAYTLDGGIANDDWAEWIVTPNYLEDWKQNGTFPNDLNIECETITVDGAGVFYDVLVYNSVKLGKTENRLQVVPSGVQLLTSNTPRLTATEDGQLFTYATYVPTQAKSLVTKDYVEQLISSGGSGGGSDIPNTPTNLIPANGTNNLGTGDASITFTASVYFSPVSSAMNASQWRFSEAADFSTLLFTTGDRSGTSTSYTLTTPLTTLGAGKTVYWQVRYKDSTGAYSNWSSPTTFTTTTTAPAPNQPTNISPVNNATEVGDRGAAITLTGSTYVSAASSAMTAAQWQVTSSTDAGYATPIISTGDIGGTSTSYTVPNPNALLSVNTTYRWRIRYKDSAGLYSAWSSSTVFTTASSFTRLAPFTPINELPVNGATGQGLNATAITLKGTAYNSPESSLMAASQWQITATADTNFNNVIVDTGDVLGTSIERVISSPSSILQPNTTYRWRVRYKDSNGLYSGWSSATTFTTAGSFALLVAPQRPSNVLPANLATNLGYNQAAIVLQGSPYQHTRNVEMAARQFQITSSADTSFNDIIVNTNEIQGNQLTYVLNDPSLSLSASTTYRWRVRYKSIEGVWSDWSSSTRFTTANTFANDVPTIITQPTDIVVALGGTATFFISAIGTNLTYQWRKNGVAINGATAPLYTFTAENSSPGAYTCVVSNPAGSVTSNTAQLTLRVDAPVIIQQPQNQTVAAGSNATFSVIVTGTTPLSYQWRKGGVNISGATSPSYTIPAAVEADAGAYSVVITNTAGSVTSTNATLAISAVAPAITVPPQNLTVNQGASAAFSVTAAGSGPLTYQWRKNGVNIGGATNSSYVISTSAEADAGGYSVVVTNSAGSATSATATLVVNIAPVITQQPTNVTTTQGSTATFTVQARGTSPITYQWKKLTNGTYQDIVGATQPTYSISSTNKAADETSYQVVVTNSVGTVTSNNVTLTVNLTPPAIVEQPQNQTVNQGQNATFAVSVSGVGPFTYQWRKDGVNISGATASSVVVSNVTVNDQASYSVVVSGPGGSVTSSSATLTVIALPVITTHPAGANLPAGATGSLFVGASGNNLAYQWRRNGVAISGATSPVYSFVMADNLAGSYTCTVTNVAGSVTSNAASITLQATAPTITQQPQSAAILDGNPVTFSVQATGTATLTYQWRRNGDNISGATSSSYTFNVSALTDHNSNYSVVVTNAGGSVTSAAATLTVNVPPVITQQPVSTATSYTNFPVTLEVRATPPTATFQWFKNSSPISGATQNTLSMGGQTAGVHQFYCVVTASGASVTSNTSTVTVANPTNIPTPSATKDGQTVYFSSAESISIPTGFIINQSLPVPQANYIVTVNSQTVANVSAAGSGSPNNVSLQLINGEFYVNMPIAPGTHTVGVTISYSTNNFSGGVQYQIQGNSSSTTFTVVNTAPAVGSQVGLGYYIGWTGTDYLIISAASTTSTVERTNVRSVVTGLGWSQLLWSAPTATQAGLIRSSGLSGDQAPTGKHWLIDVSPTSYNFDNGQTASELSNSLYKLRRVASLPAFS